jgi:hypothetical protein
MVSSNIFSVLTESTYFSFNRVRTSSSFWSSGDFDLKTKGFQSKKEMPNPIHMEIDMIRGKREV